MLDWIRFGLTAVLMIIGLFLMITGVLLPTPISRYSTFCP